MDACRCPPGLRRRIRPWLKSMRIEYWNLLLIQHSWKIVIKHTTSLRWHCSAWGAISLWASISSSAMTVLTFFSDPLNNLKHYYQYLPPPDDLWSVFWVAIDNSKFKPKVLGWQGWSLSYRDLIKIIFLLFWIILNTSYRNGPTIFRMIWDRPRTY